MQPDDRVLVVGAPAADAVLRLAARLTRGLVVVIGPEASVPDARKATAQVENVMWLAASADGRIPWQDGFFGKIVAPLRSGEVLRVLAPEGELLIAAAEQ